jgi:hypothetical protein
MTTATELAVMEWDEGLRRLESLDVGRQREEIYRSVVGEIVDELNRRVGQTFTLDELARVYAEAAPWMKQVAQRTSENVWAYDLTIVGDAAFARFARGAADYRG